MTLPRPGSVGGVPWAARNAREPVAAATLADPWTYARNGEICYTMCNIVTHSVQGWGDTLVT